MTAIRIQTWGSSFANLAEEVLSHQHNQTERMNTNMFRTRQIDSRLRFFSRRGRHAALPARQAFSVGDVLSLEMVSSSVKQYGEVLEANSGEIKLACRGRLLQLAEDRDKATFTDIGAVISASDSWLKAYSNANIRWSDFVLKDESEAKSIPSFTIPLALIKKETSLSELTARVLQDPTMWTAGTSPDTPNPTGVDYQTLCAGELISLSNGLRGIAMVQLWFGWGTNNPNDDGLGLSPQLTYNPLVITLLQSIASNPDLAITLSPAPSLPGSPCLGLTALISANKEPYLSWARHMGSFGAQSAIVAESSYYKLLIGKMLGYNDDNIVSHIRVACGPREPTAEVQAAVTKTLNDLSRKQAKIPWNVLTNSRGKKSKK